MDQSEIQQNWPEVKRQLQQKYPQLTEEELVYEIGKEGELLKRLQAKLGKNWEDIRSTLSLMG